MHRLASFISVCLLLILGARAPSAAAKELPFHGNGEATWDNVLDALVAPPATFEGGGSVTHMGNTTQTEP